MSEMKTLNGYEIVDAKAREELDGKLNKYNRTDTNYKKYYVYAVNNNNEQVMVVGIYGGTNTSGIPMFDGSGCLTTNSPKNNSHAATKSYVDDAIEGVASGGATDEWISLGVYDEQTETGQDENTGINYSVAVPKFINIYGSLNFERAWGGEQGAGYDNVDFNVLIPYNASNFGASIPFAVIGYSSYSGAIYRVSGNARIVKTTNDDGSVKITAEHSGSSFTITDITDKTDYSINYNMGYSYETKILTHKI